MLTLTENYAAIYTNGVLESSVTEVWPALNTVGAAWSLIGRSLFAADPYLNATIDELRIYDGLITASQIAADLKAGPDVLALPVEPDPIQLRFPYQSVVAVLRRFCFGGDACAHRRMDKLWHTRINERQLANSMIPATNAAQFFQTAPLTVKGRN